MAKSSESITDCDSYRNLQRNRIRSASSTAIEVYNQLVNGGQVHRGYLGILPGRVPAQMAKQNNVPEGEGALVNDVSVDDGPAAKAGIKSGDIIVEFNGNKIKDDRDLVRRSPGLRWAPMRC